MSKYDRINTDANALTRAIETHFNHNNGGLLWRNNVGTAYPVSQVKSGKRPRPVKYSYKGSPDIIGFDKHGYFVGLEIKVGSDRLGKDQVKFLEAAKANNARVVVIRKFEEYIKWYEKHYGAAFRKQV